ncbi:MAG: hypothetical protein ACRDO4_16055 [Nocardioides sp.]
MLKPLSARALAACAAVLSLGLAAPAMAAVGSIDDPTGDASATGLDITRATLDNRDRSIMVRVRFDAAKRGDLIVSVDPRGARGLRLVSQYRPAGTTKNFVLKGAFTDKNTGGDVVDCDGFRVRWNADTERARLTLPSSCLRGGDYGAVRFTVLTERPRGGDEDIAPDEAASSGWIARG